jgi:hypothetical protein
MTLWSAQAAAHILPILSPKFKEKVKPDLPHYNQWLKDTSKVRLRSSVNPVI